MELKRVELYGGAIVCEIPSTFDDLSKFLPVPDNQEVFVYHSDEQFNSNSDLLTHDHVLSFEIVEYLSDLDDIEAGRKLFDDLSYCNESRESKITNLNVINGVDLGLSEAFNSVCVSGTMEVCRSKCNKDVYNKILVLIYNVRMQKYKCELLVSYSFPADAGKSQTENEQLFEQIVATLKVVDDKLFSF